MITMTYKNTVKSQEDGFDIQGKVIVSSIEKGKEMLAKWNEPLSRFEPVSFVPTTQQEKTCLGTYWGMNG